MTKLPAAPLQPAPAEAVIASLRADLIGRGIPLDVVNRGLEHLDVLAITYPADAWLRAAALAWNTINDAATYDENDDPFAVPNHLRRELDAEAATMAKAQYLADVTAADREAETAGTRRRRVCEKCWNRTIDGTPPIPNAVANLDAGAPLIKERWMCSGCGVQQPAGTNAPALVYPTNLRSI